MWLRGAATLQYGYYSHLHPFHRNEPRAKIAALSSERAEGQSRDTTFGPSQWVGRVVLRNLVICASRTSSVWTLP